MNFVISRSMNSNLQNITSKLQKCTWNTGLNNKQAISKRGNHMQTMKKEHTLTCTNHRRRETGLTCYKCGKPMCVECARSRREYIGYWCKQCDAATGLHRKSVRVIYPPAPQRMTWRISIWGSLVATALLTACVSLLGPAGFLVFVGIFVLWGFLRG